MSNAEDSVQESHHEACLHHQIERYRQRTENNAEDDQREERLA